MAKLTTAERNALSNSKFAIPSERKYPVDTKARAANAKSRAAQFASPSLEKKVDARANKVLHHSNYKDHDKFLHKIT
jgi:hypothetical protein